MEKLRQTDFAASQKLISQQTSPGGGFVPTLTIGYVVDTNDPQQMGRIRAVCPSLNDNFNQRIDDIPWAIYSTPFGGSVAAGTRGAGDDTTTGNVSYGMWAIPKVGAQVLIMCLDNDPSQRVWVGCLYGQLLPHTLPHGRYFAGSHPKIPQGESKPVGPFSTTEHPIEPLNTNLKTAFGTAAENFEWRTRGADYSAANSTTDSLHTTKSEVPDDKEENLDGVSITQGYGLSRIAPELTYRETGKNYDSTVYSLTSPGFHSISMDDRQENCRVRIRTTGGHQILMDDTNERVYISTSKGKNWIEMDQAGNIDVYTDGNISYHAKKTINFTADENIRLYGKKGVHILSDDEVRISATLDLNLKAGGAFMAESASAMNLLASADVLVTGAAIHLNGPGAASATKAFYTNRIPEHEPWARTMTSSDTSTAPELPYNSPEVGKTERGSSITRGSKWRR